MSRLLLKKRRRFLRHRAEATGRDPLPWSWSCGARGQGGQADGQEEALHRFSRLPRLHDR